MVKGGQQTPRVEAEVTELGRRGGQSELSGSFHADGSHMKRGKRRGRGGDRAADSSGKDACQSKGGGVSSMEVSAVSKIKELLPKST